MQNIKRIIKGNQFFRNIYRVLYRVVTTLYWNSIFALNKLLSLKPTYGNCFVFTTVFGKIKKNNWGDDLNIYIFKMLTPQKIQFVPFERLYFAPNVKKYSLIGSIIGDYDLDNTIIYGSGAITSNPDIKGRPEKVLSVRGPLTRDVLIKNGIDCPAVYGDPALLLPLVYKPQIKNNERIGIIPHYRTLETNWLEDEWISDLKKNNEIVVIDMSKYENWTDIIDLICSCKMVLSESLHGLIVAESYSIPSVWVEIIPHNLPWEWDFKFNDFYCSICKKGMNCIKVYDDGYSIKEILKKVNDWKIGTIDYDSMLKVFPFEIKGELIK